MKGYQLKITIEESNPPIWRRVEIPAGISFQKLDEIIENVFGWKHRQLHEFRFPGSDFRIFPYNKNGELEKSEEKIDFWMENYKRFEYMYDFNDCWMHEILVESMIDLEKDYPQVTDFQGANMIEDCGGIQGYYKCIEEAKPFDKQKVNERLKESFERKPEEESGKEAEERDKIVCLDSYQEFYNCVDMKFQRETELKKANKTPLKKLRDYLEKKERGDLIQLARANNIFEYGKWNKEELVSKMAECLTKEKYIKDIMWDAPREELEIFRKAAKEPGGVYVRREYLEESLLLSCYGVYSEDHVLQIPEDIRALFKEYKLEEYSRELEQKELIGEYCESALYLYGVIPLKKLTEIYNSYEQDNRTEEEMEKLYRVFAKESLFASIENDHLVAEELSESFYKIMQKDQGNIPYYLPDTKEKFLEYGFIESQRPDEKSARFMEFLQKKLGFGKKESLVAFCEVQESIRYYDEIGETADKIFKLQSHNPTNMLKRQTEVEIMALKRQIRRWENRGFTDAEREKMNFFAGLPVKAKKPLRDFKRREDKIVPFKTNK